MKIDRSKIYVGTKEEASRTSKHGSDTLFHRLFLAYEGPPTLSKYDVSSINWYQKGHKLIPSNELFSVADIDETIEAMEANMERFEEGERPVDACLFSPDRSFKKENETKMKNKEEMASIPLQALMDARKYMEFITNEIHDEFTRNQNISYLSTRILAYASRMVTLLDKHILPLEDVKNKE